ncbi:Uncharacterised protein [Mycobacterium tuberculosis]|nr:Uncharacterised protein [Mycobacterium tuberculosis]
MGATELLDRPAPSLFEHDHVKAGPGQRARDHRAARPGADDHRIGPGDGWAVRRQDDGQLRVGARRVMFLGAGEQFVRVGVGAVGQQHDRLQPLHGRSDFRAQCGDPVQHPCPLVRVQSR